MTQKIMAVVDTTDRSDGDALVWDAASNTHVYRPIAGVSASVAVDEVMNFPSIEGADGAQPEWWEESAGTATLTEEDVAGESITETWERCLKVVTTADVYAYQRFTYADQPRLKNGRTVSCRVAVWAVAGATARVRLQSSVGSLDVATTTAAAWTILTLEGVVLDGTYVDLRLEVNNGTAYFVPLAFGVGDTAPNELPNRSLRYRRSATAPQVLSLSASNGISWTDLDLTASASALAALVELHIILMEGASAFRFRTRPNGSAIGGDNAFRSVAMGSAQQTINAWTERCDDGQVIEYELERTSGSSGVDVCLLHLDGWWEWA